VTDGAQAWEAFLAHRPDVVISDWIMPGLTGPDLCRKIRAHATEPYAYFIMVTNQGGPLQVTEGMTAGADDYLVKPLDPAALSARLLAAARVTVLHRQLSHHRTELEEVNRELAAMALRDPLTGLGNRRALHEDLGLLEARVARYGQRYCIALLDVDHFKSYNDTYGHQAGDRVLQAVAAELRSQARRGDVVYRYGGEEFLCVFPEQTQDTAAIAVERMRAGMERLAVAHADSSTGLVSLSAGLAMLDPEHTRTVHEVLKDADDALYRAKQLGRNRVEHAADRQQPSTAAPPGSRFLDDAVIAGLEGLDDHMLTELVPLYFEQAAKHLIALGGAIGRKESLAVSRTAHTLKGSSSTLGAEYVAEIAAELETMAKTGDLSAAHDALTRLGDGIDGTRDAFQSRSDQHKEHGHQ
jgi:two-component system chemotaxis response regulator CheY